MSTSKKKAFRIEPFKHKVEIDPKYAERTWKVLDEAICEIYNHNASGLSFEELYRNAYNMVLHKYGDKLYMGLVDTLSRHLKNMASTIEAAQGGLFLEELNRNWLEHNKALQMIRDILMYMDRTYVPNYNKTPVHELGLNLWRDYVVRYPKIKARLLDTLLDLVYRERSGEVINRGLMRNITKMLMDLGIDVYQEDFEKPFLEAASGFYKLESQEFIECCDCGDYLKKAERRLNEEIERVSHYLDPKSETKITAVVEREMIASHMNRLVEMENSGLVHMLIDDRYEDLGRMYSLFKRVSGGLGLVRDVMTSHLRETGRQLVTDPEKLKDPVEFVQRLLDEKDKYDKIITTAFINDKTFQNALNSSFEYFINLNPRSPEFISLFVDDKLRKGLKGVSEEGQYPHRRREKRQQSYLSQHSSLSLSLCLSLFSLATHTQTETAASSLPAMDILARIQAASITAPCLAPQHHHKHLQQLCFPMSTGHHFSCFYMHQNHFPVAMPGHPCRIPSGSIRCQSGAVEAPEMQDVKFSKSMLSFDMGKDRLSKVPASQIRNFSIIAHIDHGKSTLADKLLQVTGTVSDREMKEQFLDNMDLERERGITIKLQAARMRYVAKDGEPYCLNLIDTPGHVDFSYEVSRSLAACEGALLVVDASQGVEAQTLANVYLALENNLEIIPVLNKIDLPGADPERVRNEIEEIVGLDCSEAIFCSAKEGIGIQEILESIVAKVPPPKDTSMNPLRALIFDSYYDPYRGVIVYFRVVDGSIKIHDKIQFMASGKEYEVDELGVLSPGQMQVNELFAGEVGYLAASIRSVADARVGDTITSSANKAGMALSGYQEAVPMVFCGLFPVDADQFGELREALEKLQLNDAALKYEPESSSAMGFGFRCGFLGLLHMEIVQERLEREYGLNLITTAPSVVYRVQCADNTVVECSNPCELPEPGKRVWIEEPFVNIEMITPKEYIGTLMELAQERRGEFKEMKYITESRASVIYILPLAEMVGDFFDQLKSRSKGYASMEYSLSGYRKSDLVRLDILINGEPMDPLAAIVHKDKAFAVGRALTQKLKELIPRQMFKIPIQAAIGTRVIASESISAMRKDVLAKCYGGDISRKKKLLKKQAEGKKRMKSVGRVEVPQDAFMAVLRLEKEVV